MGDVIDIGESKAGPEIEGRCNVVRKDKRCKRKAGEGTDHPGYGPCKYHMGSVPTVSAKAHKDMAIDYTRSIAGELDINPVEAMLWAVRLGAGAVAYWQQLLASEDTDPMLALAIEKAYGEERDRMTKTAALCISAGLAERRIKIAEKQGDMLAMVLEAALEENGLSAAKIAAVKKSAAKLLVALPGLGA